MTKLTCAEYLTQPFVRHYGSYANVGKVSPLFRIFTQRYDVVGLDNHETFITGFMPSPNQFHAIPFICNSTEAFLSGSYILYWH